MELELAQIISQIFAFLIMLWILKRYAWKPLLNVMEERKKKIQTEFDAIEANKAEIEKLKEEYQAKIRTIETDMRAKVQEEISKGKQAAQDIQQKALDQSREIMKKAKAEADSEIEKAKKELKTELVNLIINSTQKVLGKELEDPTKQKTLIEKILAEANIS